jgi:hypothetical protein
MSPQQAVGCDQPVVIVWERRRERLLGATIGATIALCFRREAKAKQHAQRVGVEWQEPGPFREHKDLVRPGLSDHWELGQGAARLGQREAHGCSQIAIPMAEHELSRVAEPGGADPDRDGPSQPGDRLQLGPWGGKNGCWVKAHFSSKGREGSTTLHVRHEIADLLPEDQVKRIPTDRRGRPTVVAPESRDH